MGRRKRKEGALDILLGAPWWICVAAGLCTYVFLRWIIPSLFASSPVLAALSRLSQSVAWFALPVFSAVALFAFVAAKRSEANNPASRLPSLKRILTRPAAIRKEEWDAYQSSQTTESVSPPDTPDWTIESLRSLEWKRFELLCARYYEMVGFKSITIARGADGGIDVKLYKIDPDHPIAIVQCKAWNTEPVGVKEVRELLGVMAHEKVVRGIFITSGSYSKDAIAFGDSNPIHLLDGPTLLGRILHLDVPRQKELAGFAFDGDYKTPSCASCGIKMIQRESRRGPFWGCVNYPRCRSHFSIRKT
jgi:restriction system protein